MKSNSASNSTRYSRSPPPAATGVLRNRIETLDVVAFNIAGKKDPDANVSVGVELHVEDGGVIE